MSPISGVCETGDGLGVGESGGDGEGVGASVGEGVGGGVGEGVGTGVGALHVAAQLVFVSVPDPAVHVLVAGSVHV